MEIVSFEIAQKLKEKGFYYKCFATYDKDGMLGYNYVQPEKNCAIGFDDCLCANNIENNGCIDAPTISQVLKWLREEKNIHINIDFYSDKISDNEYTYWSYRIIDMNNGKIIYKFDNKQCMLEFESYEEVAITGVEYVLDNLI